MKKTFVSIYITAIVLFTGCSHLKDDDILEDEDTIENEDTFEDEENSNRDPLDEDEFLEWNKPEYQVANTALNENYLSAEEKEVFYYLNLARINPPLFARTYVAGYDGEKGWTKGYAFDERKQSLIEELLNMKPLDLVYPDITLYRSAQCFAYEGGKLGIVGHDRSQTSCGDRIRSAECCQYGGNKSGLSIIMSFLIDTGENNAALGHRRICLNNSYNRMGVSIEDHARYGFNAVLNLWSD